MCRTNTGARCGDSDRLQARAAWDQHTGWPAAHVLGAATVAGAAVVLHSWTESSQARISPSVAPTVASLSHKLSMHQQVIESFAGMSQ